MSTSGKAESATTSEPNAGAGAESGIVVAVLSETDKDRRYPMYRVIALDGEGAFLGGKLLLERGEVVTLELRFEDNRRAEVKATVVAVEDGDTPGIRVAFSGISDENRVLLTKRRVDNEPSDQES